MPLLDRYLGRIILQYTLITMLVLLGLFAFLAFLDQLGDLGKGAYTLLDAIAYIALTIPRTVYELFPMAALLGTIIGLSLLANHSELIVMRASGVSVAQITLAALKVGGLFVIAAILIGELVAPVTESWAERGRAEALRERIGQPTSSGLWLRDGNAYINAGEVLPNLTLLSINIFEFDSQNKLRALTFASDGEFKDEAQSGGYWVLNEVRRTRIDADGNATTEQLPWTRWQSSITPQILSVFLLKPEQLSLGQLRRYIRHLRANQQQTDPYELALWGKVMLPLSTAIMVVLGIPFVFANRRSGTMGRSLFLGIMLGLGFYAANKGFGYFALTYGLPPTLGATLPFFAFLLLAVVLIRRVE